MHSGRKQVQKIIRNQYRIQEIYAGGEVIKADLFVMANGSWLPETMKQAGLSIPLMPGKGYSFKSKQYGPTLRYPAILCEARVAITPMAGELRFGGTMELAGFQHKVNMNRVPGVSAPADSGKQHPIPWIALLRQDDFPPLQLLPF